MVEGVLRRFDLQVEWVLIYQPAVELFSIILRILLYGVVREIGSFIAVVHVRVLQVSLDLSLLQRLIFVYACLERSMIFFNKIFFNIYLYETFGSLIVISSWSFRDDC